MTDLDTQNEESLYWDVFPKLIRASCSALPQGIPLSIRGTVSQPVFESSNSDIASVDEYGIVRCGLMPGAAIIIVWNSDTKSSVRHVQVEIYGNGGQNTNGDLPS